MNISGGEWLVLKSILLGMAETEKANRDAGQSPGPLSPEVFESFVADIDSALR